MIGERPQGRAVVFPGPRRAELREGILFPKIDDDSVVIKTQYSGISRGTEMDLYHNQMHVIGGKGQWYPMLPGYEPVGEVVEVGKNVSHLKVGDRAVATNLFHGYDENYCCAWGGHSEYIVVNPTSHPGRGPERAVQVPSEVSTQEAACSCLVAVALHGLEKVVVDESKTVMIIGQGVIGISAAQIVRSRGARVIVSDLCDFRLGISREVGIERTVHAGADPKRRGR